MRFAASLPAVLRRGWGCGPLGSESYHVPLWPTSRGKLAAKTLDPRPQGDTRFPSTRWKTAAIGFFMLFMLAAEGDCEAEVVFVTPTPPPAAKEATVEARVAERLHSQALDPGAVSVSPTPAAAPTPRLECDNPDLLARAEHDFNIRYRPDPSGTVPTLRSRASSTSRRPAGRPGGTPTNSSAPP